MIRILLTIRAVIKTVQVITQKRVIIVVVIRLQIRIAILQVIKLIVIQVQQYLTPNQQLIITALQWPALRSLQSSPRRLHSHQQLIHPHLRHQCRLLRPISPMTRQLREYQAFCQCLKSVFLSYKPILTTSLSYSFSSFTVIIINYLLTFLVQEYYR